MQKDRKRLETLNKLCFVALSNKLISSAGTASMFLLPLALFFFVFLLQAVLLILIFYLLFVLITPQKPKIYRKRENSVTGNGSLKQPMSLQGQPLNIRRVKRVKSLLLRMNLGTKYVLQGPSFYCTEFYSTRIMFLLFLAMNHTARRAQCELTFTKKR